MELQNEDSQESSKTSSSNARGVGVGSVGLLSTSGTSARTSRSSGSCLRGGRLRVVGARCSASSTRGLGIACKSTGLAAGEEAVDAALDTLGVCLRSSRRAIALVALGGALVGCDGLGSVGARITQACSLAVHISGLAGQGAAHGGSESRSGRWSRGSRRDGSSLGDGEGASDESEDHGCVLHFDYGWFFGRGRVCGRGINMQYGNCLASVRR